MLTYTIKKISSIIVHTHQIISNKDAIIKHLVFDTRQMSYPDISLFFAFKINDQRNGHQYVIDAYEKGVRNFILSEPQKKLEKQKDVNIIYVDNTLKALQLLTIYHRQQFHFSIIGITGSNGKTVIKEWLADLCTDTFNVVKNPQSYNSQIGVPLSVWQINSKNNLGIFEAGISKPNEMDNLQKIISPSIGVLTNIGDAHIENFEHNPIVLLNEKLKLFKQSKILIYKTASNKIHQHIAEWQKQHNPKLKLLTWGEHKFCLYKTQYQQLKNQQTKIIIKYAEKTDHYIVNFFDKASLENITHCIITMLYLGINKTHIQNKLQHIKNIDMRLSTMRGINNTFIINDAYSNDIASLQLSIQHLLSLNDNKTKTIIVSDIAHTFTNDNEFKTITKKLFQHEKLQKIIFIGKKWAVYKTTLPLILKKKNIFHYSSTQEFLLHFNKESLHDETILIKGMRVFEFERIVNFLYPNINETVLEINTNHIIHNLRYFKSLVPKKTKIMLVVKAFGYGLDSEMISQLFTPADIDYLAVAHINEGVALRKYGNKLPIMVMNPDKLFFDILLQYQLEPEIYSIEQLNAFISYLLQQKYKQKPYPIHIKLDTGMHRLGIEEKHINELITLVKKHHKLIDIKSVFSHLAASDKPQFDDFTQQQFKQLQKLYTIIKQNVTYRIMCHIANSHGH